MKRIAIVTLGIGFNAFFALGGEIPPLNSPDRIEWVREQRDHFRSPGDRLILWGTYRFVQEYEAAKRATLPSVGPATSPSSPTPRAFSHPSERDMQAKWYRDLTKDPESPRLAINEFIKHIRTDTKALTDPDNYHPYRSLFDIFAEASPYLEEKMKGIAKIIPGKALAKVGELFLEDDLRKQKAIAAQDRLRTFSPAEIGAWNYLYDSAKRDPFIRDNFVDPVLGSESGILVDQSASEIISKRRTKAERELDAIPKNENDTPNQSRKKELHKKILQENQRINEIEANNLTKGRPVADLTEEQRNHLSETLPELGKELMTTSRLSSGQEGELSKLNREAFQTFVNGASDLMGRAVNPMLGKLFYTAGTGYNIVSEALETFKMLSAIRGFESLAIKGLVGSFMSAGGLVLSLFSGPSDTEIILQAIAQIGEQITELRKEQRQYFEQLHQDIGHLFERMVLEFQQIQIGKQEVLTQIRSLGEHLNEIQSQLTLTEINIKEVLAEVARRNEERDTDVCLEWDAHYNVENILKDAPQMITEKVLRCFSSLYSCAAKYSSGVLETGNENAAKQESEILKDALRKGKIESQVKLLAQIGSAYGFNGLGARKAALNRLRWAECSVKYMATAFRFAPLFNTYLNKTPKAGENTQVGEMIYVGAQAQQAYFSVSRLPSVEPEKPPTPNRPAFVKLTQSYLRALEELGEQMAERRHLFLNSSFENVAVPGSQIQMQGYDPTLPPSQDVPEQKGPGKTFRYSYPTEVGICNPEQADKTWVGGNDQGRKIFNAFTLKLPAPPDLETWIFKVFRNAANLQQGTFTVCVEDVTPSAGEVPNINEASLIFHVKFKWNSGEEQPVVRRQVSLNFGRQVHLMETVFKVPRGQNDPNHEWDNAHLFFKTAMHEVSSGPLTSVLTGREHADSERKATEKVAAYLWSCLISLNRAIQEDMTKGVLRPSSQKLDTEWTRLQAFIYLGWPRASERDATVSMLFNSGVSLPDSQTILELLQNQSFNFRYRNLTGGKHLLESSLTRTATIIDAKALALRGFPGRSQFSEKQQKEFGASLEQRREVEVSLMDWLKGAGYLTTNNQWTPKATEALSQKFGIEAPVYNEVTRLLRGHTLTYEGAVLFRLLALDAVLFNKLLSENGSGLENTSYADLTLEQLKLFEKVSQSANFGEAAKQVHEFMLRYEEAGLVK